MRLKNINLAWAVFSLIGIRISIFSATWGDAIAISAICGCIYASKAFNTYLDSKKEAPLSDKVAKELEDIKASMSGIMIKNSVRPEVNLKDNRTVPKFY